MVAADHDIEPKPAPQPTSNPVVRFSSNFSRKLLRLRAKTSKSLRHITRLQQSAGTPNNANGKPSKARLSGSTKGMQPPTRSRRAVLQKAGIQWPAEVWRRLRSGLAYLTPKGLYARTLIIIIAPIVLLEGVIAFVFMERHWAAVSRRLSEATARDIAALIEVYKNFPNTSDYTKLIDLARDQMNLSLRILPAGDLPAPQPKPFFALLDRTLSNQIRKKVRQPFWIDTVGQSRHVEIRVKLDKKILRFIALRSQTFASNSHIFLLWMVGSSVVLLVGCAATGSFDRVPKRQKACAISPAFSRAPARQTMQTASLRKPGSPVPQKACSRQRAVAARSCKRLEFNGLRKCGAGCVPVLPILRQRGSMRAH